MCYQLIGAAVQSGTSMIGQQVASQSSSDALNYNASTLKMQGQQAIMQGGTAAQIQQNKVNAEIGTGTAAVGASGTTLDNGGSSGKVLAQDAELGGLDVAQIQANAQRTAWGYDTQAALDQAQADAANRASDMTKDLLVGAGPKTLLGRAANVGDWMGGTAGFSTLPRSIYNKVVSS